MTHWRSPYIFSLAFMANVTYLATTQTPNLCLCAAIDLIESRSVFKPLNSRVVNLHRCVLRMVCVLSAHVATVM